MKSAKYLKGIRERLEVTQAVLAEATGYDVTQISKLENGAKRPTEKFLRRLCEAYNLDFRETCLQCGRVPEEMQQAVSDLLLKRRDINAEQR